MTDPYDEDLRRKSRRLQAAIGILAGIACAVVLPLVAGIPLALLLVIPGAVKWHRNRPGDGGAP